MKTSTEQQQRIDDAFFNKIDFTKHHLQNPFEVPTKFSEEPDKYLLWRMSQPDYFYFFVKNVFGPRLTSMQCVILRELWTRKFPIFIASRGAGKSWLLAVYAALRAQILKDRKIIVIGAAFRQSKVVFEYIEKMWIKSPVWQSLAKSEYKKSGPHKDADMWKFKLGTSEIIFLPLGDGENIRGQRAHDLIVDEFNTVDPNTFEIKIMPFASVAADPIERMEREAKIEVAEKLGVKLSAEELFTTSIDNQLIISGTPGYTFQHFFKYYTIWKKIITCKGDKERMAKFMVPEGYSEMDPKNFSIIRIPWNIIPRGIMDVDQITRSKFTMNAGNFASEYGAGFSEDSQGFFKRSLIEQATVSPQTIKEIQVLKGDLVELFTARLYGSREHSYVYGVDTASERDNFAIVILEIHGNHRRVVYSWTTRKDKHRELVSKKKTADENFFSYCARHIRNLMKKFPCQAIAIDEGGGGYQIIETLHDKDKMEEGEQLLWPIFTYKKDETGHQKSGLHIIHPISFGGNGMWTATANHGMKKDLEDLTLLFPHLDGVQLANASYLGEEDLVESLEDVMLDINELKDEMSNIIHSCTASGREHWDTPELKTVEGKKGRMRKDRYSALLMANAVARMPSDDNPFHKGGYDRHYGWAEKLDNDKIIIEDGTLYGKDSVYNLPANIYD